MKKVYYSWQINVPASKDLPAHTVSNAASVNGVYKSYQECEDYLKIALLDYPGAKSQIFQVHETLRTIKSIPV